MKRDPVDGRVYVVTELTDGYIVAVIEPNGIQIRKAALTIAQTAEILKGFGLDIYEKDTVH